MARGSYAEYAAVPASSLVSVSENVSLEDAAASLSAAYAEQGVQIVVERPRIIVSQASVPVAGVAPPAAMDE